MCSDSHDEQRQQQLVQGNLPGLLLCTVQSLVLDFKATEMIWLLKHCTKWDFSSCIRCLCVNKVDNQLSGSGVVTSFMLQIPGLCLHLWTLCNG